MSMSETLELVSANRSFGGWHKRYRHYSRALDCDMIFAVYLPPQAEEERVPLPGNWKCFLNLHKGLEIDEDSLETFRYRFVAEIDQS